MVVMRKGMRVKFVKIQKSLKGIVKVEDAFLALEKFGLSNKEENEIVNNWKIEQQIMARRV